MNGAHIDGEDIRWNCSSHGEERSLAFNWIDTDSPSKTQILDIVEMNLDPIEDDFKMSRTKKHSSIVGVLDK